MPPRPRAKEIPMFRIDEDALKQMAEDREDASPGLLDRARKRLKENPEVTKDDADQELFNYLAQVAASRRW
jgi:hypothetical protein